MSLQPLREIAEHEMEYDDFAAMADEMALVCAVKKASGAAVRRRLWWVEWVRA